MKKNDAVFLRHIIDAASDIRGYLAGMDFDGFLENKMAQDAVVRRLEIIGEAANKLSPELKEAHPRVLWKDIISMRNRLIHAYFETELEIVWEVARFDLPQLEKNIGEILRSSES